MNDDECGQRLAAALNKVLPSWGRFNDIGDGTLINEGGYDTESEVNITIRDGEAGIAIIGRDYDTGDFTGERDLGYTDWDDVTSIVGLLAEAYPSLAAEARKGNRRNRR